MAGNKQEKPDLMAQILELHSIPPKPLDDVQKKLQKDGDESLRDQFNHYYTLLRSNPAAMHKQLASYQGGQHLPAEDTAKMRKQIPAALLRAIEERLLTEAIMQGSRGNAPDYIASHLAREKNPLSENGKIEISHVEAAAHHMVLSGMYPLVLKHAVNQVPHKTEEELIEAEHKLLQARLEQWRKGEVTDLSGAKKPKVKPEEMGEIKMQVDSFLDGTPPSLGKTSSLQPLPPEYGGYKDPLPNLLSRLAGRGTTLPS